MKKAEKYIGTEDNFQITCAGYLDSIGANWCHVANERKTKVTRGRNGKWFSPEGSKLKKKGVKKGVPDVLIFDPRHGFAGLAIELKVDKNRQSPEQRIWQKTLTKCGWKTLTTWSLDEFIQIVDDYFQLE